MSKNKLEFPTVGQQPAQYTRREVLQVAGAGAVVLATREANRALKSKDRLRDFLREPRGHNPLFRFIADAQEAALGDRAEGPLAAFNLGFREHGNPNPDRFPSIRFEGTHVAPSVTYSGTLIEELVNPEVNYVDGQRINAVIANQNPEKNDSVANVWFGLLGNKVNEGASLLRVAELAHQNPKSRAYGFDMFAQGDSGSLNDEQKADLRHGDFRSTVRPFLKLLQEKGETRIRLFGSSLGATVAVTAAAIAQEEFGLQVEVVGAYGLPIQEPVRQDAERDFVEGIFAFGYGAQTAALVRKDMIDNETLPLYHSHPFDARLMEIENMDDPQVVQTANSIGFLAGQLARDPMGYLAHGLARVSVDDVITLGSKFVSDNPNGNMYFHTGSNDQLSPATQINEIVDGIRGTNPRIRRRVTRQVRSGEGHLSLVQPIELAADIARNSQPIAA